MAARKTTKKSAKKAPASSTAAKRRSSPIQKTTGKKAAGKKAAGKKASADGSSSGKAAAAVGGPTAKKAAARKAVKKGVAKKSAGRRKIEGPVDRVAEIQRVIDVMVAAGAVEVELEEAGSKLRVRLKEDPPVSVVGYAPAAAPMAGAPAALAPAAVDASGGVGAAAAGGAPAVDESARSVFKSPMVGTFYRAASPDAEPYAEVGTEIHADDTICILEAMKVMNEIKAEMEGRVVEILVQNGEPVEFGQPLFVIEGL